MASRKSVSRKSVSRKSVKRKSSVRRKSSMGGKGGKKKRAELPGDLEPWVEEVAELSVSDDMWNCHLTVLQEENADTVGLIDMAGLKADESGNRWPVRIISMDYIKEKVLNHCAKMKEGTPYSALCEAIRQKAGLYWDQEIPTELLVYFLKYEMLEFREIDANRTKELEKVEQELAHSHIQLDKSAGRRNIKPLPKTGGKRGSVKRGSVKRGSEKRGSTKRGSTKRGSTKRGSTKRGSTKRGSTKRGSTKRGSTKRGSTKRGSTKRGSTKRGSTKRGSTKRGSVARKSSVKKGGGGKGGGGGGGSSKKKGGAGSLRSNWKKKLSNIKFETRLNTREMPRKDVVMVEDHPPNGPRAYFIVTQIRNPDLPKKIKDLGLPLSAVVKYHDPKIARLDEEVPENVQKNYNELLQETTNDYLDRRSNKREVFDLERDLNKEKEKLKTFWEEFMPHCQQPHNKSMYENTVLTSFRPDLNPINASLKNRKELAKDHVYNEICLLSFFLGRVTELHRRYNASLNVIDVAAKAITTNNDLIIYNSLMNVIPTESCDVPVVLDSLLVQTCYNEPAYAGFDLEIYGWRLGQKPEPPLTNSLEAHMFRLEVKHDLVNESIEAKPIKVIKQPRMVMSGDSVKWRTLHLGKLGKYIRDRTHYMLKLLLEQLLWSDVDFENNFKEIHERHMEKLMEGLGVKERKDIAEWIAAVGLVCEMEEKVTDPDLYYFKDESLPKDSKDNELSSIKTLLGKFPCSTLDCKCMNKIISEGMRPWMIAKMIQYDTLVKIPDFILCQLFYHLFLDRDVVKKGYSPLANAAVYQFYNCNITQTGQGRIETPVNMKTFYQSVLPLQKQWCLKELDDMTEDDNPKFFKPQMDYLITNLDQITKPVPVSENLSVTYKDFIEPDSFRDDETKTEEEREAKEAKEKKKQERLSAKPRGSTKRGSTKRGSTKRGSTKRGSTKRGSTKRGSTKRGSTKRGSTKPRGSTKRGSTKRGSTKRGSTKRGSTKRGSVKRGSTRRGSDKGKGDGGKKAEVVDPIAAVVAQVKKVIVANVYNLGEDVQSEFRERVRNFTLPYGSRVMLKYDESVYGKHHLMLRLIQSGHKLIFHTPLFPHSKPLSFYIELENGVIFSFTEKSKFEPPPIDPKQKRRVSRASIKQRGSKVSKASKASKVSKVSKASKGSSKTPKSGQMKKELEDEAKREQEKKLNDFKEAEREERRIKEMQELVKKAEEEKERLTKLKAAEKKWIEQFLLKSEEFQRRVYRNLYEKQNYYFTRKYHICDCYRRLFKRHLNYFRLGKKPERERFKLKFELLNRYRKKNFMYYQPYKDEIFDSDDEGKVQDYEFDMQASWPNGLHISVLKSDRFVYIKQKYLSPRSDSPLILDESYRCISLDGTVVKFMKDDTVLVYYPWGAIVTCVTSWNEYKDLDEFTHREAYFPKFTTATSDGRYFESQSVIRPVLVESVADLQNLYKKPDVESTTVQLETVDYMAYCDDLFCNTRTIEKPDGTNFLYEENGTLVVRFPDGTEIRSSVDFTAEEYFVEWTKEELLFWFAAENAEEESEFNESNYNTEGAVIVQGVTPSSTMKDLSEELGEEEFEYKKILLSEDGFLEIQFSEYSVHHPNYTGVRFGCQELSCYTLYLPGNTVLQASGSGLYHVTTGEKQKSKIKLGPDKLIFDQLTDDQLSQRSVLSYVLSKSGQSTTATPKTLFITKTQDYTELAVTTKGDARLMMIPSNPSSCEPLATKTDNRQILIKQDLSSMEMMDKDRVKKFIGHIDKQPGSKINRFRQSIMTHTVAMSNLNTVSTYWRMKYPPIITKNRYVIPSTYGDSYFFPYRIKKTESNEKPFMMLLSVFKKVEFKNIERTFYQMTRDYLDAVASSVNDSCNCTIKCLADDIQGREDATLCDFFYKQQCPNIGAFPTNGKYFNRAIKAFLVPQTMRMVTNRYQTTRNMYTMKSAIHNVFTNMSPNYFESADGACFLIVEDLMKTVDDIILEIHRWEQVQQYLDLPMTQLSDEMILDLSTCLNPVQFELGYMNHVTLHKLLNTARDLSELFPTLRCALNYRRRAPRGEVGVCGTISPQPSGSLEGLTPSDPDELEPIDPNQKTSFISFMNQYIRRPSSIPDDSKAMLFDEECAWAAYKLSKAQRDESYKQELEGYKPEFQSERKHIAEVLRYLLLKPIQNVRNVDEVECMEEEYE